MIIVLGFYKRKPGLTHEEFSRHWFDIHGPLTLSVPGIQDCILRYVQHHLSPYPGLPLPDGRDYDGFSEAWFPDLAAKQRSTELFSQSQAFRDHEKEFLDLDQTRWMMLDDQRVMLDNVENYMRNKR